MPLRDMSLFPRLELSGKVVPHADSPLLSELAEKIPLKPACLSFTGQISKWLSSKGVAVWEEEGGLHGPAEISSLILFCSQYPTLNGMGDA